LTLIEQVELPAKEAGSVSELLVREGDVVQRGDQLAAVEADDARIAVTKAERDLTIARTKADNDIAVRFARKAHEVVLAEHRRALESVQKFSKSVSATEMDQLRLTAEKAELEIEQAEHDQAIARLTVEQKQAELEGARLQLARHQIVAPFAGMVVQIKKPRGEWANPGDAVVRLVRLDRLRVEAFAASRDVSATLQGKRVALSVDVPGKGRTQFEGTIVFVSPEVNPVNAQVRIWAEVENSGLELRPGQPATMTIENTDAARRAKKIGNG
jgi:macrolide-specific efflux system membrane fusion protein